MAAVLSGVSETKVLRGRRSRAEVILAVLSLEAVMKYVLSGDHCRSVTSIPSSWTGSLIKRSPVYDVDKHQLGQGQWSC